MGIDTLNTTLTVELIGELGYYPAMGLYILTAALLGGMVGSDRERKRKSAGFKTHMLICLGATLYTAIGILNSASTPVADPSRLSAQIVSGIGFLGAGAIIQSRRGIFGLTTAATIWVVAAIGVAIGSGYPFSAALFTITALTILKFLDPFYKILSGNDNFHIELKGMGKAPHLEPFISARKYKIYHYDFIHNENENTYLAHYYINLHPKDIDSLIKKLSNMETTVKIEHQHIYEIPDFDD